MRKLLTVLLTVLAVFAFNEDAFAKSASGGRSSKSSSSSRNSGSKGSRARGSKSRAVKEADFGGRDDFGRVGARFDGDGDMRGARQGFNQKNEEDALQKKAPEPEKTPDEKLWDAVQKGDFFAVTQALDAGAYVNYEQAGVTVLESAVRLKNETIVMYLVSKGADPSLADSRGRNALYTAFESGIGENVVRTFLENKASVNDKDFSGVPVFFYAFLVSQKDEIIALVTDLGKPDFNLADSQGNTILHTLIKQRMPMRFIDFVLMKKPDVNLRDSDGNTPLMLALQKGDTVLVEKLIAAGADVNVANEKGATPLNYALLSIKDPALLEKVITRKINVNQQDKNGNTPLMFVLKTSREPTAVELLLDADADVNIKDNNGDSPLMYVARMMRENDFLDSDYFMELLLDFGAKVNERDNKGVTPLMNLILSKRVAVMDDVKLVNMFIKSGVDLDAEDFQGDTALLMAVRDTSSVPLVNALIMGGADVKKMGPASKTPLQFAQENLRLSLKDGYDEVLKKLTTNTENQRVKFFKFLQIGSFSDIKEFIAQGADVNAADEAGDTPLMKMIVYSRPLDEIKYLVENGANVEAVNNDGDTPLMKASMHNGAYDVVEYLLSLGVAVNAKNKKGDTALRRAVLYGDNPQVVEALVRAGADVNVEDAQGQTIWDYAEKNPSVKEKDTYVKLLAITE